MWNFIQLFESGRFCNLLGGGCVEICLNEVISPSPGELLFDASAQSPPSDKTVEMLHFTSHG